MDWIPGLCTQTGALFTMLHCLQKEDWFENFQNKTSEEEFLGRKPASQVCMSSFPRTFHEELTVQPLKDFYFQEIKGAAPCNLLA